MCVCGVHMRVCLSVCAPVCTEGWKSEADSGCLSLLLFTLYSEAESLIQFAIPQAARPSSTAQRFPVARSPSPPRRYPLAIITGGLPYPAGILCGLWGS